MMTRNELRARIIIAQIRARKEPDCQCQECAQRRALPGVLKLLNSAWAQSLRSK